MKRNTLRVFAVLNLLAATLLAQVAAPLAGEVTSPAEQFGFNLGDDYHLANYRQLVEYWKKLDEQSDRLALRQIGSTAEGRPMWMAVITSPENHARLEEYRQIAKRLALAKDLTPEEARELASRGKAVVWIDGGLHATEVLGAQQLMELVYQMVSRDDPETLRILDDVILLAACANPDGMDLVADWYMREPNPRKRSTGGVPVLYQKYIGHDNNRDFYMVTQPETEAINRVFYIDWFPQIIYNHHQTGPAGTVLFAPPFRDPFNYNIDPLLVTSLDLVGAAMHSRFVAEDKPGATMRSGAGYSTWWNGGLRTTAYFHNMIGLLTETIGSPNPIEIPFLLERQLPKGDLPYPIEPQTWHFRQSVEYSITANRAVLDLASRQREHLLMNIYRMARNSIERGNRDSWTVNPQRVEAAAKTDQEEAEEDEGEARRPARGLSKELFQEVFRSPEARDPRGYILPAGQADFLTAGKFVNALLKNGVEVHRATADFRVAGKRYPAGSYVVKTAQAFRPHVLDMFEPQRHPNDFQYAGGPPKAPYDSAGWTLALQMGVEFDRVLEGFDGPFEQVQELVGPAPGTIAGSGRAVGYALSHRVNDSFVAINRLLADGERVYWIRQPFRAEGRDFPAGTIYIPRGAETEGRLRAIASETGLNFQGLLAAPTGSALKLKPVRIGLWDRYGGSMPSGWLRWIFERFEFPFELVFAPELDAGKLRERFDVLIFPDGAFPRMGDQPRRRVSMPDPESVPERYRGWIGSVSAEETIPRLEEFLREGGVVLAIGSSTSIAGSLGLDVKDALVQRQPSGEEVRLPREKFYVPGSLLEARVDNRYPLAFGMGERVEVYFDNSPAFVPPEEGSEARAVVWYDSPTPLRSGWAWGQEALKDAVAALEVPVGRGKLFLFGPKVTFRAQPHGTFKLVFNGIYGGTAEESTVE